MSVAGNDYRLQKKVYREVTVNRQTSVGCYFFYAGYFDQVSGVYCLSIGGVLIKYRGYFV